MLPIFALAVFFMTVGLVVPPLFLVGLFFAWLFYSRTRWGVRRIRAAEEAKAAKLRRAQHERALRYFS